MRVAIASMLLVVGWMSSASWAQSPAQSGIQAASGAGAPDASGVYRVGNGVWPPQVLYQPEPEFSEQERKLHISPHTEVSLVVEADGLVRDVQVIRSAVTGQPAEHRDAALALDAKIVAAVRRYRFKPALLQGQAVPVALTMDIDFTIF